MIAGVVTGAGRSARLYPVTSAIPKAFLPIGLDDDGTLEYPLRRILSQLSAAGAREIIVVGTAHPWFARVSRASECRVVSISAPPSGEWVAVAKAGALLDPDTWATVIVVSSDNVFEAADFEEFGAAAARSHTCMVGVAHADSTRELCVVELTECGHRISELIEKPEEGFPGLVKAGLYAFPFAVFKRLVAHSPTEDRFGERSLTTALQWLIDEGLSIRPYRLRGGFIDVGTPDGLRAATQRQANTYTSPRLDSHAVVAHEADYGAPEASWKADG